MIANVLAKKDTSRSKYPVQYAQEIKRSLQKKSKSKNPLRYSQATKKSFAKKIQIKMSCAMFPGDEKGVCKNKSPDQITLYNNFVQLSEKSNCASDHFKRNSIFRVKFSN